MKNWKIATKLRIGFTAVFLLAAAVVVFGVYGMERLNTSNNSLYERNFKSVQLLGDIRNNVNMQRVLIRNMILYDAATSPYKASADEMSTLEAQMDNLIAQYQKEFVNKNDASQFDLFLVLYREDFKAAKTAIAQYAVENNADQGFVELVKSNSASNNMIDAITLCYQANTVDAANTHQANNELFKYNTMILFVLVGLAFVTSMVVSGLMTRVIIRPLRSMLHAANAIAEGDVEVAIPDYGRDELGSLAEAFKRMAERIKGQAEMMARIAEGDLSIKAQSHNDRDVVGRTLQDMSDNLHQMVHEMSAVSSQVAIGAHQVSDGSQALAHGSVEQATAIEQLSSSTFEISLNTKENAKMAAKAAELYVDIKKRAQEGSDLMNDMVHAVQEINAAGASISKIIRLINDIAFQTNILALNAAVEAANAGQHGKGFAVVAGEVRNLAAKSSDAAKDTDALIENSLDKSRQGLSFATKTAQALTQIVQGIMQSAQLIDDIAKSSTEQSLGIEQVNVGIEQVAQVINLNSSTAEKSALAAEEMAAQAGAMDRLVSRFKLRPEDNATNEPLVIHPPIDANKSHAKPVISLDDGFGKY